VAAVPPAVRRTRAIAWLAVAGAVPLTAGAILWVTGTAMGLASRSGWSGLAVAGEFLVLAGLLCGLGLITMAALWHRQLPRRPAATAAGPPTYSGPSLMPLASPEQQAYLAELPSAPAYPQPDAGYLQPDGPVPAYPRPDAGYPQPDGPVPAYPQPGVAYPPPDGAMPAYPQPPAPWPGQVPDAWPPPPAQGQPR
jgi:hypothetical protein